MTITTTTDFLMDLLDFDDAADAACAVRHLLADVSLPPAGTKTPTDALLGLL